MEFGLIRSSLTWTVIAQCGLFAIAFGTFGCLSDPPQLSDPAVQGIYDDGDPEHRPGQPCLICHGPGHFPRPPGEVEFQVGGTVYGGIADLEDEGLSGVEVELTDADGFVVTAVTNRTGNFLVSVDGDVAAGTQLEPGWFAVPSALQFPLRAVIRRDGDEQEMRTNIWRSGSCAHCHGPGPGVDSVGRVYLYDEGAQP